MRPQDRVDRQHDEHLSHPPVKVCHPLEQQSFPWSFACPVTASGPWLHSTERSRGLPLAVCILPAFLLELPVQLRRSSAWRSHCCTDGNTSMPAMMERTHLWEACVSIHLWKWCTIKGSSSSEKPHCLKWQWAQSRAAISRLSTPTLPDLVWPNLSAVFLSGQVGLWLTQSCPSFSSSSEEGMFCTFRCLKYKAFALWRHYLQKCAAERAWLVSSWYCLLAGICMGFLSYLNLRSAWV